MSKTVVTKVFKKNSNGSFSEGVPIGTSSEYVSVAKDGNQVMSLNTLIGDPSVFTEISLSDKVIEIEGKTGIVDASATQKGLMSSTDFKKINPQILQNNEDLNNITSIGWYRIIYNSASNNMLVQNAPAEVQSSCWMQVQQLSDYSFFQKIRTSSGLYFERQLVNGSWSNWSRLDKVMTAATNNANGTSGTVPIPMAGQQNNFLKGDGTWSQPENTWVANAVNINGYVSAPAPTDSNKVWKTDENGNPAWRDERIISYNVLGGANEGVLVPIPTNNQQDSFLKGNGTWGEIGGKLLSENQYNNLVNQYLLWKGWIDLIPPSDANYGGGIDFHYGDPEGKKTYTSRISESTEGTISLIKNIDVYNNTTTKSLNVKNNSLFQGQAIVRKSFGVSGSAIVQGAFTVNGGLNASGTHTITGNTAINGVLTTKRADNNENGHTVVVSSSSPKGGVFMLNSYQKNVLEVVGNWGTKGKTDVRLFASTSSDIRLKQNIKKSNISGLQLINKIPLYEFDWKEDKRHQKIGFIADQLEKIDSNLSIGSQKLWDENGNPIYKSVNTFYLQGFEIKAIQELSQQNQELKKEINSLKEEIKELKKK